MSAPTVLGFFNPTDLLALGGSFIPQTNTRTTTLKRAQGLLANGDEGIHHTYGSETKISLPYEYQSVAGNITLPEPGTVVAGYHIDSVDLEYRANAWPLITVNCHNHGTNPHTTSLRTFTPVPVFPAQFGIPRTLSDAALPTANVIFKLGTDDTGIGIKSMKYSISCSHLDEPNEVGEQLAGENRDGVEKLDIGLTGIPAAVTVLAGWDKMTDGDGKGNTAADSTTVSLEHHILANAAA